MEKTSSSKVLLDIHLYYDPLFSFYSSAKVFCSCIAFINACLTEFAEN